jgi:uncharacterized protein YwlG (UPF0340 family)
MLDEKTVVDVIEVFEDGQIRVRMATRILRDGIVIAQIYRPHGLDVGDSLATEDLRVIRIATAVWTPEVIAAREAAKKTQQSTKP